MSQSLYSAMGGIAAATTQMSVISNNVANINTTAFKSSSVHFSDVYSATLSSGSVATSTSGGTNPIQVGVGTKVSAIRTNYNTGSWMSTGQSTDLMIQGQGFFTVEATDGSTYYTRAGDFSIDSDGNLVTSEGYKVLGTNTVLASTSSGVTVKVPQSIVADVKGNINLANQNVQNLNNTATKSAITQGTFTINITDAVTGIKTAKVITIDSNHATGTVGNLVSGNVGSIQSQLGPASGITVSVDATTGKIKFDADPTVVSLVTFGATGDTSNFVSTTDLASAKIDPTNITSPTTSCSTCVLDYTVNISNLTSVAEATAVNTTSISADGSIQVSYKNGATLSVTLDATKSNYEFVYTTSQGVAMKGDNCVVAPDVATPANFVIQMATITNTNGLLSVGSNLFESGPNTGDIAYTVGGEMGTGKLESGGLEASNVDLSSELSSMILAQRAIQANSRVFTTTSDVMKTVVQMGQ